MVKQIVKLPCEDCITLVMCRNKYVCKNVYHKDILISRIYDCILFREFLHNMVHFSYSELKQKLLCIYNTNQMSITLTTIIEEALEIYESNCSLPKLYYYSSLQK